MTTRGAEVAMAPGAVEAAAAVDNCTMCSGEARRAPAGTFTTTASVAVG
jgi:hypothetical protein